jgi:hypothetical protein
VKALLAQHGRSKPRSSPEELFSNEPQLLTSFLLPPSQPYAGSAAVLVNEFDTGHL